jgi:hypothetical protein
MHCNDQWWMLGSGSEDGGRYSAIPRARAPVKDNFVAEARTES